MEFSRELIIFVIKKKILFYFFSENEMGTNNVGILPFHVYIINILDLMVNLFRLLFYKRGEEGIRHNLPID
jgi:hypothetical protein